ncbi:MAG: hypothetical protein A2W01_10515 [Candidatus Solincola sediminis]|nr:MAG: hypothetical protein A2W01_10515 [Candidatus Solincola sediminis]
MPVLLTEEKMREIAAPYLKPGEEISIISFASRKGFWKSLAFIFTLTNKRFILLETGWTSHKNIKDFREIPLDAEFSYGMKRGSTLSAAPGEAVSKGLRMNTLFLVMPDGTKESFTFQDSDKDIPAAISGLLGKIGKRQAT